MKERGPFRSKRAFLKLTPYENALRYYVQKLTTRLRREIDQRILDEIIKNASESK